MALAGLGIFVGVEPPKRARDLIAKGGRDEI